MSCCILPESFPSKYFNHLVHPPYPPQLNSIFNFGVYIQKWKGWVKRASGSTEGHNLTFFFPPHIKYSQSCSLLTDSTKALMDKKAV